MPVPASRQPLAPTSVLPNFTASARRGAPPTAGQSMALKEVRNSKTAADKQRKEELFNDFLGTYFDFVGRYPNGVRMYELSKRKMDGVDVTLPNFYLTVKYSADTIFDKYMDYPIAELESRLGPDGKFKLVQERTKSSPGRTEATDPLNYVPSPAHIFKTWEKAGRPPPPKKFWNPKYIQIRLSQMEKAGIEPSTWAPKPTADSPLQSYDIEEENRAFAAVMKYNSDPLNNIRYYIDGKKWVLLNGLNGKKLYYDEFIDDFTEFPENEVDKRFMSENGFSDEAVGKAGAAGKEMPEWKSTKAYKYIRDNSEKKGTEEDLKYAEEIYNTEFKKHSGDAEKADKAASAFYILFLSVKYASDKPDKGREFKEQFMKIYRSGKDTRALAPAFRYFEILDRFNVGAPYFEEFGEIAANKYAEAIIAGKTNDQASVAVAEVIANDIVFGLEDYGISDDEIQQSVDVVKLYGIDALSEYTFNVVNRQDAYNKFISKYIREALPKSPPYWLNYLDVLSSKIFRTSLPELETYKNIFLKYNDHGGAKALFKTIVEKAGYTENIIHIYNTIYENGIFESPNTVVDRFVTLKPYGIYIQHEFINICLRDGDREGYKFADKIKQLENYGHDIQVEFTQRYAKSYEDPMSEAKVKAAAYQFAEDAISKRRGLSKEAENAWKKQYGLAGGVRKRKQSRKHRHKSKSQKSQSRKHRKQTRRRR